MTIRINKYTAWLVAASTFSVLASNVQRFAAGERQVVGVVKNALIEPERRVVGAQIDSDDYRRKFEELKAKLDAAGLFDADHKQPLPAMPTICSDEMLAAIDRALTEVQENSPASNPVKARLP